jgi:hypothetical protein
MFVRAQNALQMTALPTDCRQIAVVPPVIGSEVVCCRAAKCTPCSHDVVVIGVGAVGHPDTCDDWPACQHIALYPGSKLQMRSTAQHSTQTRTGTRCDGGAAALMLLSVSSGAVAVHTGMGHKACQAAAAATRPRPVLCLRKCRTSCAVYATSCLPRWALG